ATGSASGRRRHSNGHDGPDLDRAEPRGRDLRGPLERLVERVDLDHVEAAELLLRLGERAVRHDLLAVADADGAAGRGRLQRVAADVGAALPELGGERAVLGV